MKFYTQLYVGEGVRHLRSIKRKLKGGRLIKDAYLITFAAGNDLLEIYDAKVFSQKYYKSFSRMIVGIASDYEEAVDLVIKMIEESLNNRGDCDVKAYLEANLS